MKTEEIATILETVAADMRAGKIGAPNVRRALDIEAAAKRVVDELDEGERGSWHSLKEKIGELANALERDRVKSTPAEILVLGLDCTMLRSWLGGMGHAAPPKPYSTVLGRVLDVLEGKVKR